MLDSVFDRSPLRKPGWFLQSHPWLAASPGDPEGALPELIIVLEMDVTVKTSISLTDSQEAFARELVERGRYPSLSAVLQHGLELLRSEKELEEAELTALRALLKARRSGEFIDVAEGRERTRRMIRAKKAG